MTPCSLYRPTSHSGTSSTSGAGFAETTHPDRTRHGHPGRGEPDPRPDRNEHNPPTIPADPDETAVENIPCTEKIIQRLVWTHFKKPSST